MTTTSTGFSLQHVRWGTAPLHIPDEDGGAYKTELVLERSRERTEKITWWHGRDPRRDPHNHPWSFDSTIYHGGITMTVWMRDTATSTGWRTEEWSFTVGQTYSMPAEHFHTVDSVLPGTVTHMVCGQQLDVGWGHLVDGAYVPQQAASPTFLQRLHALNPHLRPK